MYSSEACSPLLQSILTELISGVFVDLVTAPGFKPGETPEKGFGGFDSHPLPLLTFRCFPPGSMGRDYFPCRSYLQLALMDLVIHALFDRRDRVEWSNGGVVAQKDVACVKHAVRCRRLQKSSDGLRT